MADTREPTPDAEWWEAQFWKRFPHELTAVDKEKIRLIAQEYALRTRCAGSPPEPEVDGSDGLLATRRERDHYASLYTDACERLEEAARSYVKIEREIERYRAASGGPPAVPPTLTKGYRIAGEPVTDAVGEEFGRLLAERDQLRERLGPRLVESDAATEYEQGIEFALKYPDVARKKIAVLRGAAPGAPAKEG